MEKVVELLNEKNIHLEKFYQLNQDEILNFSEDNFDNLESFYNKREGLLNLIRKIDEIIDASNYSFEVSENIEAKFKKEILELLDYKNDLVTKILSQDLQILSFIENAKSGIIKELTQVRAAKKAVGAYKSGAKVNELDEEA